MILVAEMIPEVARRALDSQAGSFPGSSSEPPTLQGRSHRRSFCPWSFKILSGVLFKILSGFELEHQ